MEKRFMALIKIIMFVGAIYVMGGLFGAFLQGTLEVVGINIQHSTCHVICGIILTPIVLFNMD